MKMEYRLKRRGDADHEVKVPSPKRRRFERDQSWSRDREDAISSNRMPFQRDHRRRCPRDVPPSTRRGMRLGDEMCEETPERDEDGNGDGDVAAAASGQSDREKSSSLSTERRWRSVRRAGVPQWTFLEHNGPAFAAEYERLPDTVRLRYDGRPLRLSAAAEEAAGFYARMLHHDYVKKERFNKNFFRDWRTLMTAEERRLIVDLKKCDFTEMHDHFRRKDERTPATRDEIKTRNKKIEDVHGYCTIDGRKEKIGNYRIEPPGLFHGRGDHPSMGRIKRRITPEDVIINCSKDSRAPVPPRGHAWREVRHDNTVAWLDSWTDSVLGKAKYVTLCRGSVLNSRRDRRKFETARRLHGHIDRIRDAYRRDFGSPDVRVRQRAVALYLIDRLALRAGTDKDDASADTVGCCTLRVEHVRLRRGARDGTAVFDFLGKDSIRYRREVAVERAVYRNLEEFLAGKRRGDPVFDRLSTHALNEYLKRLMPGLTTKVFRTYNASVTLQRQLERLTDPRGSLRHKLLAYRNANRAAALLCNHRRAVPKGYAKTIENLSSKIQRYRQQVTTVKGKLKRVKDKRAHNRIKKVLGRLEERLENLQLEKIDRKENKNIALGTSKLNYLDPRITVAWCKKNGVPIEKVFSKKQRERFQWAIRSAGPNFRF